MGLHGPLLKTKRGRGTCEGKLDRKGRRWDGCEHARGIGERRNEGRRKGVRTLKKLHWGDGQEIRKRSPSSPFIPTRELGGHC